MGQLLRFRDLFFTQALAKEYPGQFRLDYALSRESKNRKGGKMYIQVREWKGPHPGVAVRRLAGIIVNLAWPSDHCMATSHRRIRRSIHNFMRRAELFPVS